MEVEWEDLDYFDVFCVTPSTYLISCKNFFERDLDFYNFNFYKWICSWFALFTQARKTPDTSFYFSAVQNWTGIEWDRNVSPVLKQTNKTHHSFRSHQRPVSLVNAWIWMDTLMFFGQSLTANEKSERAVWVVCGTQQKLIMLGIFPGRLDLRGRVLGPILEHPICRNCKPALWPYLFQKPREISALKVPQTCKYHLLFNCNLNLYNLIVGSNLVAVNGHLTCQIWIICGIIKTVHACNQTLLLSICCIQ